MIAPSNRKIMGNTHSKSARQSAPRMGGRKKTSKQKLHNFTHIQSEQNMYPQSDRSYNDTYHIDSHDTLDEIEYQTNVGKVRNRQIKNYDDNKLKLKQNYSCINEVLSKSDMYRPEIDGSDYTYSAHDKSVPDLRKAKSSKYKKSSSKHTLDSQRNMYTSNGFVLDTGTPSHSSQFNKDFADSDIRYIDKK